MSEPEYDEETGSWADYSSEFMFPGDGPECSATTTRPTTTMGAALWTAARAKRPGSTPDRVPCWHHLPRYSIVCA